MESRFFCVIFMHESESVTDESAGSKLILNVRESAGSTTFSLFDLFASRAFASCAQFASFCSKVNTRMRFFFFCVKLNGFGLKHPYPLGPKQMFFTDAATGGVLSLNRKRSPILLNCI